MKGSPQHSADGAPHDRKEKRRRMWYGTIQDRGNLQPACTTDRKFLDKLKEQQQESVHRRRRRRRRKRRRKKKKQKKKKIFRQTR